MGHEVKNEKFYIVPGDDENGESPADGKLQDIFNNLPASVKKIIVDQIDSYQQRIIDCLKKCETPIEQILALSMNESWQLNHLDRHSIDLVAIEPQSEFICNEKTYRVDFCLVVFDYLTKDGYAFIVECDGHDFHEKTKEQVKIRNDRDRNLTANGNKIIHFSGSEIFKNAPKCADDIYEFILSTINSDRKRYK